MRTAGRCSAIMGIQPVRDVNLIRHAYVVPDSQGRGIGSALLEHLLALATRPMLVGTWAAATWAIRFYERHGFEYVGPSARPSCCGRTGTSRSARSRPRWCSPRPGIEDPFRGC